MMKTILIKIGLFLAGCSVALSCLAASNLLFSEGVPKKLSLEEAILLALRYNTSIQNSEIDRISQKFSLRAAANEFEVQYALTAAYNASQTRANGESSGTDLSNVSPTVSLNNHYGGNYALQMNNPTTIGTYNPGLNLTITQPIMRGFGTAVTLAPYYNAVDQEVANKLSLKNTLISEVGGIINDYRNLIGSQYDVKTSEIGLENYEDTLRSVKALIKAGRKAPSDIIQAQSDYTSQEVTLESSKNQVVLNKLQLVNNIGLQPQVNFSVPEDVKDLKQVKLNSKALYGIALENNPTYLTAKLQVRQNERLLLIARDNMRIQLDATVNLNTGNGTTTGPNQGFASLSNNYNTTTGVGFLLTVPIQDFNLKSAVISAQSTLAESKISLAAAQRSLMNSIINDVTNARSNYKQVQLAINSVKLAEQNQRILNAKYKLGMQSTFEVNQQLKNLLDQRGQLITAKIRYLNSITQLYVDTGTLLGKYHIEVRY